MTAIHILAPFINANGGDWHAIDLSLKLGERAEVQLWSQNPVHPDLAGYPIRIIQPYQGEAPFGGTLYICGTATAVGHWYEHASFERTVLIHNLCDQDVFYRSMHRLSHNGARPIEIAYASEMVRDSIGLPGEILYPIPHPQRFKPLPRDGGKNQAFTIGRISTDRIGKHHYQDIPLYRQLAAQGNHIRIVGGTCLRPWLGKQPNIELLPTISQRDVPAMLNSLDCFFYRVCGSVKEAFGIIVAEALLSDLPLVCYNEGGYTEFIKDKKNSFLFTTNQEAIAIINQIKSADTQGNR